MKYLAILLALFANVSVRAQVSVLTYHNDLARTGRNLSETVLTPSNVNSTQFGKLFTNSVDGVVYGQPLFVPNLSINANGTQSDHNVVFVVTEHDSVYAFDADGTSGSSPLWKVSFLNAANGVTTVPSANVDCGQITPELGITSTPVIDPVASTLYTVAMTLENGNYVQRLHALDLATGAERSNSPVVVQATFPGTGEGGSTLTFDPKNYKQRPGLLLLNGVVYTAWSSHCDIGTYHGWLIGYDAQSLRQVSVYNNTPNGNEGSFWAANAAPAADSSGNIYMVAGNGSFDAGSGGPDLGESYSRLSTSNGLSVADYFTPYNYASLNSQDLDVGSSGALLLPDEAGSAQAPHLLVSAGKEGRIYLLNRDNLGKLQTGADTGAVQTLAGVIAPLFGIPAYFNNTIYFSGAGDALKAFKITSGRMSLTPSSQSPSTFPYPGSAPTVSANGTGSGIVWAVEPTANGRLHAYDATNLAKELYNSSQNSARDALGSEVKYSSATVANGRVYVGTQNSLAVYGLLAGSNASIAAIVNAATFTAGPVAPGSLVSIFGTNLASSTGQSQSFPLSTTIAGVTVTLNGTAIPLLYVSPTQINLQIPIGVTAGSATLSVNGISGTINVAAVAPAIFTIGAQAAAINQDGTVNSSTAVAPVGSVVSVYGTGFGAVNPAVATGTAAPASPLSNTTESVTATIGGQAATVSFAGLAPGNAGLYQVNVEVPNLPAGNYPVVLSVGGVASNSALLSVSQ